MTGTPALPTLSVRFKEGIADVPDGELSDMMLKHPGYEGDFISAETVNNIDPYAYSRQDTEPQHVHTELKFGTPVARKVEGGGQKLSPELAKIVQDMAVNMAKEMLPTMLESALKGLVAAHEKDKVVTGSVTPKVKGKPGRPKGKTGPKGLKSLAQTPEPQEVAVLTPTENPLSQVEAA